LDANPEFCLMQLPCAGLLIIRDRKLLLAFSKNKACFYLPGGKIDQGESSKTALCREIREELGISLEEDDVEFYTHISAPAFGEQNGVIMEQDCFFIHRPVTPVAAAEIGDIGYFTLGHYLNEIKQAPGALQVLKKLKADNLID
jgi:8-oxo-dGTP pyrophosphatase MutT (NUDIX family)